MLSQSLGDFEVLRTHHFSKGTKTMADRVALSQWRRGGGGGAWWRSPPMFFRVGFQIRPNLMKNCCEDLLVDCVVRTVFLNCVLK